MLARTGGLAPDLPGFGRSGKPGSLRYTIDEYDRFIERFLAETGIERVRMLVHDWGAVGLAFAQRHPERIERLAIVNAVPFLPGYRWHRTARIWRTPVLGELAMGTTGRFTARLASREANVTPGPLPEAWLDSVLAHFDQGTQRAILRLYRSSPSQVLEQARARASARCARPRSSRGACRTPTSPPASRRPTQRRCHTQSCSSCRTRATGRGSIAPTCSTGSRSSCPPGDRAAGPGPRVDAHRGARPDLRDPRPAEPRPRGRELPQLPVLGAGLSLWDNAWYGGHHLLAYSVLAPALGALLGPRLLAAASMTVATALFDRADPRALPRARGARRLAVVRRSAPASRCSPAASRSTSALASGSARCSRRSAGAGGRLLGLALVTSLASPVAGAFLALALVAWALAGPAAAVASGRRRRRARADRAARARVPRRRHAAVRRLRVLPGARGRAADRRARAARAAHAAHRYRGLTRLRWSGAYLVPSAVGGNADRLAALVAAPVAACVLAGGALRERRTRLLVALAPLLIYWQANAPVTDFAAAVSTPSVTPSYYAPLLGELRALGVGYGSAPARIEVVPTASHWEARWVAPT